MAAVYAAVDPVARDNAQVHAAAAGEANAAAQAATTSEEAIEHQMAAVAASKMAEEVRMMGGLGITELANKIINQAAIDNAGLEGKTGNDVPEPISNAKRVGAAMAVAAAAAPGETDNTPHQGSSDTATENVPTATQTHSGQLDIRGNGRRRYQHVSAGEKPVTIR